MNFLLDKFLYISNFSKESSKIITVNPLNDNVELKLSPRNNYIDENENEEKIIEEEKEEEKEKEKTSIIEDPEDDRTSIKEIEEEVEKGNEENN